MNYAARHIAENSSFLQSLMAISHCSEYLKEGGFLFGEEFICHPQSY
jgi:hypothetical protein